MAQMPSSSTAETEKNGDDVSSPDGSSHPGMRKKQRMNGQKTCRVCGDCALAHNFDVVSCESCKAFFRRNALKTKIKPCAFKGDCEITPETRRFCCHCRLKKCLASGMRPDKILGDEEKRAMKEKVEENRRRKQEQQSKHETVAMATQQPDLSIGGTESSPTSSRSQLTPRSYPDAKMAPGLGDLDVVSTVPDFPGPEDGYNQNGFNQSEFNQSGYDQSEFNPSGYSTQSVFENTAGKECFTLEQATKDLTLLDFTTLLPHKSQTSLTPSALHCQPGIDLGESFQHVSHEQLPSDLRRYWRLKDEERALLSDLTLAYQQTVLRLPENLSDIKPVNVKSILERCQRYANDIVNFVKRVSDFRALRLEDQLAVLKGSSMRTFIVKSAANFIVEHDSWLKDNGYLTVEQFSQASPEHRDKIELLARFSSSMKHVIRSDPTVFAVLQVLVLFDPRDPHLTDRQQVSHLSDKYSLLLKHYVESQWSYDYAGHYLAAVRQKLQLIPTVADSVRIMFIDWLDMLEPLMRELLNLD